MMARVVGVIFVGYLGLVVIQMILVLVSMYWPVIALVGLIGGGGWLALRRHISRSQPFKPF